MCCILSCFVVFRRVSAYFGVFRRVSPHFAMFRCVSPYFGCLHGPKNNPDRTLGTTVHIRHQSLYTVAKGSVCELSRADRACDRPYESTAFCRRCLQTGLHDRILTNFFSEYTNYNMLDGSLYSMQISQRLQHIRPTECSRGIRHIG